MNTLYQQVAFIYRGVNIFAIAAMACPSSRAGCRRKRRTLHTHAVCPAAGRLFCGRSITTAATPVGFAGYRRHADQGGRYTFTPRIDFGTFLHNAIAFPPRPADLPQTCCSTMKRCEQCRIPDCANIDKRARQGKFGDGAVVFHAPSDHTRYGSFIVSTHQQTSTF